MMRRMRKKDKPLGSHNGSVREEKENRGRTSRHVAKQDGNVERKEEEKPALVHTRPYATTTNTASISNRYAHKCANKHASVTLCYDYRFHTSLYRDDCIGKEKRKKTDEIFSWWWWRLPIAMFIFYRFFF